MENSRNLSAIFGSNVFNDSVMPNCQKTSMLR